MRESSAGADTADPEPRLAEKECIVAGLVAVTGTEGAADNR